MTRAGTCALFLASAVLVAIGIPSNATASPAPIVWGATVKNSGTQTQIDAVHSFETKVGRTLRATRDFLTWDAPFPTSYENALKADGTTILLSFSTKRLNGTGVSWASIAAATPGSQLYLDMKSWADRVRDFGVPIYVTMQHEPEVSSNTAQGTATDYRAAWRTWVGILRGEHADNAKALWIMTAYAFKVGVNDRRQAPKWYPGDDVVDAMGADLYNWTNCRANITNPWNSLQTLVEGLRLFSLAHTGPELWIPEYASVEDPAQAGRRAAWLADAQALFQTPNYTRFKGILYFDLKRVCDWRVEFVPGTLAAFSTMGADPYYSG